MEKINIIKKLGTTETVEVINETAPEDILEIIDPKESAIDFIAWLIASSNAGSKLTKISSALADSSYIKGSMVLIYRLGSFVNKSLITNPSLNSNSVNKAPTVA